MKIILFVSTLIVILNKSKLEASIDCDAHFKEMAAIDSFYGIDKSDPDYLSRNLSVYSCISYYLNVVSKFGYNLSELKQLFKESLSENLSSDAVASTTKALTTTKTSIQLKASLKTNKKTTKQKHYRSFIYNF